MARRHTALSQKNILSMSAGECHVLKKWQLSGCTSIYFPIKLRRKQLPGLLCAKICCSSVKQHITRFPGCYKQDQQQGEVSQNARLEGQAVGPALSARLTRQRLPLCGKGRGLWQSRTTSQFIRTKHCYSAGISPRAALHTVGEYPEIATSCWLPQAEAVFGWASLYTGLGSLLALRHPLLSREGARGYRELWPDPVTPMVWCQSWLQVPDEALTFLQGLEDTSKDALNARLCCVVSIVLGRLGLLGSFPSSLPFPWFTCPLVGLTSPSSSSLLTGEK